MRRARTISHSWERPAWPTNRPRNFFPRDGWGWHWIGDPDCGYNSQQPGGWIYNILPYTEMSNLHDLGLTAPGAWTNNSAKVAAILQMVSTPMTLTNCPTRRRPILFPYNQDLLAHNSGSIHLSMAPGLVVARTDYAINVGDFPFSEYGTGPNSNSQADQKSYFNDGNHHKNPPPFVSLGQSSPDTPLTRCRGISFEQSTTRKDDVKDGLSETLLLGEKYLAANAYGNGTTQADNETEYSGMDNDNSRTTCCPPKEDRWGDLTNGPWAFGSAHPNAANFILCDGAVISISYSVDAENFRRMGTRDESHLVNGILQSFPVDMTMVH